LLKNGEILSKKKMFLGPEVMHMGKGALKLRTSHGFKEKSWGDSWVEKLRIEEVWSLHPMF
jgi:hypothetical protein